MSVPTTSIRNHLGLNGTDAPNLLDEFSRLCVVAADESSLEISFPWTVCVDSVGDAKGVEVRTPLPEAWRPFKQLTPDVKQGTSPDFPELATAIRIPRTEAAKLNISLDSEVFAMKSFSDQWGLQLDRLVAGQANFQRFQGYRLLNGTGTCAISALAISRANGQFGNNYKQLTNAIRLCSHFGVKRIYIPKLSQFEVPGSRLKIDDLEFVAYNDRREIKEPTLLGTFFYRDSFVELLTDSSPEQRTAVDRSIETLFLPLRSIEPLPANHLAVHIRSNDLFNRPNPHPKYPQPPLAFYKLVIDDFRRRHSSIEITLVYQDNANPVIDALQAELARQSIPYKTQSASLTEDLRVLLAHESVVFGRGTFGKAVVSLSPYVKSVYFPWTDKDFRFPLRIKGAKGYVVEDVKEQYIAIGEWKNTQDQRQLMIDYPVENLSLKPM